MSVLEREEFKHMGSVFIMMVLPDGANCTFKA